MNTELLKRWKRLSWVTKLSFFFIVKKKENEKTIINFIIKGL